VLIRSGERRILESHNTFRTEAVASPILRGIAHDVTEQMRLEKLLREANFNLSRAESVARNWQSELQGLHAAPPVV